MVVAVAEDSSGADRARAWIEQAKASYWCLIDTDHRVSDLYGMVNVPQAVWIDAQGSIVRPAETAGSTDHFRSMDRATFQYEPSALAARAAARGRYFDAVRAWVRNDAHRLDAATVARKQPRISREIATAHALFRLGLWLRTHRRADEADRHFARASELHPDSWSVWRQAADLQAAGKAVGPEFWARVDSLGERPYYPPAELPGCGTA